MREYGSAEIRNVAVVGHGASGKTTLVDALAFVSGASKRHGSIKEGTALTDFTPEEMNLLLYGKNLKYKLRIGDGEMNATYLGILEKFERSYIRRDLKTLSVRTQKAVAPYIRLQPCTLCHGTRRSGPFQN